jgi:peptidyl-prolyl cis-trans isomerase C
MHGGMKKKLILRRYNFIYFTLALSLAVAGCTGPEDTESTQPVITVGERVVTVRQYNEALKRLLPEDTTDTNSPEFAALKNELVNQFIEEELLLNEAEKFGVDAAPAEVSAEVDNIKKDSGDDAFKDAIVDRYGDVKTWEKEIKRKLVVRKTVQRSIGRGVDASGVASDESAQRYYREHAAEFTSPAQVSARMIVVPNAEDAQNIRKKLTPETFAKIAKEVSLSPERDSGGNLGFFARGEMPKEFEDAVFKLRPGEISPVIKTEYGYHIFLLEERRKAGKLAFNDVKEKIIKKLRQEAEDKELAEWIVKLKKQTKIEIKEGLL